MHSKTACVEMCRGVEDALYAIYTEPTRNSIWRHLCDCANDGHLDRFGGKKKHDSECANSDHWVSIQN